MSRAERFVRGQVEMLAGAVPKMPGEAAAASQVVARDIRSHGFARLALAMIAAVGAAALAEWLLRRTLLRATRRQGVLVEFAPLLAFAAVGLALFLLLHLAGGCSSSSDAHPVARGWWLPSPAQCDWAASGSFKRRGSRFNRKPTSLNRHRPNGRAVRAKPAQAGCRDRDRRGGRSRLVFCRLSVSV